MIFTQSDYNTLASLVFRPDYPGYRPNAVEAPNSDGVLDTGKRYAHVATKYFANQHELCHAQLDMYLVLAHQAAMRVVDLLGVPKDFLPNLDAGALRVLDYPPGTGGALHTDFDMFTINLWRNVPNPGLPTGEVHVGRLGELLGFGPAMPHWVAPMDVRQQSLVYFAVSDHDAVLPSGETVGAWMEREKGKSRYEK